MKKSSLGRRSSVLSQGRLSFADKNSSRLGLGDGKKSLIPKPCFGSKSGGRSSSADRELNMSSLRKELPPPSLQRSKSYVSIEFAGRTSTPCFTPVQYNARNTGSIYRNQMSEGGARSSSVGGLKSAKKESRPIDTKEFRESAQEKIQEFFILRKPELLEKGRIKPMTGGMFADLVNFLIERFDRSIQVNRREPVEGVQKICQLLNYRGKAEKSWLCTVNTQHSWKYVVSFLLWLVELYLVSEAFDVFETSYPEGVDGDLEINDYDFKLLVPHLLKGYNMVFRHKPSGDDTEEMKQFLAKHQNALNINDGEIEQLQQEYAQLQEEVNNSEDAAEEEALQKLMLVSEAAKRDIKQTKGYIYDTECYVTTMNEKRAAKLALFQEYEKNIEILRADKERLQAIVSTQEMSQEHKVEIETELAELQRAIQQQNELIAEFKDEVYKEDLKMVGTKTTLNKMIQAYNKEIIVNLASMPELKNVQIEENKTLYMNAFAQLDIDLKELKTSLKAAKQEAEMAVEKTRAVYQKMEDEIAAEQDRYDSLLNECSKLNVEIAHQKKILQSDKELARKTLAEIQENIKKVKEKAELDRCDEEIELANLVKKKREIEEKYHKHVETTSTSLNNRMKTLNETKAKLQDITREKMEERRQMIRSLEESNPRS